MRNAFIFGFSINQNIGRGMQHLRHLDQCWQRHHTRSRFNLCAECSTKVARLGQILLCVSLIFSALTDISPIRRLNSFLIIFVRPPNQKLKNYNNIISGLDKTNESATSYIIITISKYKRELFLRMLSLLRVCIKLLQ